jgi:YhcH/YjgK/YiaL family protein
MIIDSIENANKYTSIHPLFEKAFEYIASVDLANIEIGKYEISDGLLAIFSDKKGMTSAESIAKFECHNKNIDIQLCISGNETFGWKSRNHCTKLKEEYNPDKDVSFYEDEGSYRSYYSNKSELTCNEPHHYVFRKSRNQEQNMLGNEG